VFCRVDLGHRLAVLTTPGLLYIVSAGNNPVAVDEAEIARIQAVARSGIPAMPWPLPAIGQRVRLKRGPLTGLEGILLQVRTQNRVYVGVTLLRRGVSVEVDAEWILPIGPKCFVDSNRSPSLGP
jgi:transcription antitermination factor NusG